MRYLVIVALLLIAPVHAEDWTVTKTVKWSLLDRVARDLCEAERDDCDADWRCASSSLNGNPALGFSTCLTIGVTGSAAVWTQYRERAQRALEASKP